MFVEPQDAREVSCPYIQGNKFTQRYCVLKDLSLGDLNQLLTMGWRHFGYYFFMPNCKECNSCIPLRTIVNDFSPSKSQRKNLKKNNGVISITYTDLIYTDEIFEVYKKHSKVKFGQGSNKKEFQESFFSDAITGNSKVGLYRVEGKLVGVGFIDITSEGISSIYYCYDPDYSKHGLGTFSSLKEIELAKELGKKYYYMGYYVEGNRSMEYKSRFAPLEYLDWNNSTWKVYSNSREVLQFNCL